jgi:hypothetical protein
MTVPNLRKKHDFCAKNGKLDQKNKINEMQIENKFD